MENSHQVIYTVGSTYNGCLFTEEKDKDQLSLTEVSIPHKFKHIEAGPKHCIGITSEGKLYIWGEHIVPGQAKEVITHVPIELQIPHAVIQLSCGFDHTLILSSNGNVYGFGKNQHGQLSSDKSVKLLNEPRLISGDNTIKFIKASVRGTLMIDTDNKVNVMGCNKNLELGLEEQKSFISGVLPLENVV